MYSVLTAGIQWVWLIKIHFQKNVNLWYCMVLYGTVFVQPELFKMYPVNFPCGLLLEIVSVYIL